MRYRGRAHGSEGLEQVHADLLKRGNILKRLWRQMQRRVAIEPTNGHVKSEHRLKRNRLKGQSGDAINPLLSAAAMNLSKLGGDAPDHTPLAIRSVFEARRILSPNH